MKPEAVRQYERSLYEKAILKVRPEPDGTRPIADVERELAELILVDVGREQLRRAKDIIESLSRADPKAPGPLLTLMGDKYAFEPDRLILADDRVVENARAPLEFKEMEAERAEENLARVTRQTARKVKERDHFRPWYYREAAKGRPLLELVWGVCARETGLLT
jgi:hypothetical protein